MADPVWRATMDVLTAVVSPALYTDQNLYCIVIGRMANLSLEHGNSDASSYAYAIIGTVLGAQFGDYKAAFRFGQLGFNLAAQRGLDRFKARIYLIFGHHVMPWTKPIRTSRSLMRLAFDAAQEAGDLTYGAFGRTHLVTHLLASGDPLDEVQREAEAGLDFARQARFGLVVDRITAQLQLIRTLRGLTPIFGCFDDAGFDEERFEQHLGPIRAWRSPPAGTGSASCRRVSSPATTPPRSRRRRRLKACSGHRRSSSSGRNIISTPRWRGRRSAIRHPDAERGRHLEALAAHHRQLQAWAENCPENFADRAALVGAEMARLEGPRARCRAPLRTGDFLGPRQRLHSQRGTQPRACRPVLRGAWVREDCPDLFAGCPLRLSALGRRRQGAATRRNSIPSSGRKSQRPRQPSTIGAPVEHLDLATVIKASQAVSGEIVLDRLMETLMTIALEHAGAERGLLLLLRDDVPQIEAEARTAGAAIEVMLAAGAGDAGRLARNGSAYRDQNAS